MRKRGVEGEGWAGVSPVSVVAVETPGRAQSIKRGARAEPNGVHLSHERVPLLREGGRDRDRGCGTALAQSGCGHETASLVKGRMSHH